MQNAVFGFSLCMYAFKSFNLELLNPNSQSLGLLEFFVFVNKIDKVCRVFGRTKKMTNNISNIFARL